MGETPGISSFIPKASSASGSGSLVGIGEAGVRAPGAGSSVCMADGARVSRSAVSGEEISTPSMGETGVRSPDKMGSKAGTILVLLGVALPLGARTKEQEAREAGGITAESRDI